MGALFLIALFAVARHTAPPASEVVQEPRSERALMATRALFERMRSAPPATLSGTVRSSQGAVSGALVCAACAGCETIGARPSACTRSEPGGRYAFTELPAGGYYVHASAEGFAPGSALGGKPLTIAASEARSDVDIMLAAGGVALSGTVVDATGGPVPHARVRAVRLVPPQFSLDVESDDGGRFAFSLPEGSILVAAEADGYAPSRAQAVAPSRDVKLVLTPGASVRGVVIAAESRQPLPGMRVRAVLSSNRNAPLFASAISDERGAFRIEGLEPGAYALSALGGPWFGELPRSIDLGLADQVGDVELIVSAAAEVSGRVMRESGGACEQGFVALRATAAAPGGAVSRDARRAFLGQEQVAEIQPDGAVHFPGMQPGHYKVAVRCIGRLLRAGPQSLQVAADPIADLTWTVADGTALVVSVVDGRKQPVAFAPFALRKPENEAGRRAITVYHSDARGHFEIPGLPPGEYELLPRQGARADSGVKVELRAELPRVAATLELPGSSSIEVTVETAEGAARDDVRVSARLVQPALVVEPSVAKPLRAVALGNGRFRVGPIAAASYVVSADDGVNPQVRASADDGRVTVGEGATARVKLVLPRAASLSGRVSDERGAPAANVWVSASRATVAAGGGLAQLPAFGPGQRVLTDGDGQFALEGLVQGARYTLRAIEPYGSAAVVKDVTPGSPVQVRLPAPATIAGAVLDAGGQPVPQFSIQVTSLASGSVRDHTVADAQGRFALSDVAPGKVRLALVTPYGESAGQELELPPGARAEGLRVVVRPAEQLAASPPMAAPRPNQL
jgi:hypothetical protein